MEKNRIWDHFSFVSPFLGDFFPISGRGPFSISRPIFSYFGLVACFPFYARLPDSQDLRRSGAVLPSLGAGMGLSLQEPHCCGNAPAELKPLHLDQWIQVQLTEICSRTHSRHVPASLRLKPIARMLGHTRSHQ